MKTKIFFMISLLTVFSCLEGPTGPTGPEGPQGENVEIFSDTISLSVGNLQDDYYWSFGAPFSTLEGKIVTVNVRAGTDYYWFEPEWTFRGNKITIYKTGDVKPGYEALIIIVY